MSVPVSLFTLPSSLFQPFFPNHRVSTLKELTILKNNLRFFVLLSPINTGGFPGGLMVKNPPANGAGDMGLIPGLGGPPGEGNDSPPQ